MTKSDRRQAVRDAWWTRTIEDAERTSGRTLSRARSEREVLALLDLIDSQRAARERRDRGAQ